MQWSEQVLEHLYEHIGEQLRTARARQGLTQIELGQKVGLTRSSIANIEAGRQRAMIHTIMQIANVLDVKVVELFPEPDLSQQSRLLDTDVLSGQPETTYDFVQGAMRRAFQR